jgi:hypothetical protein
VQRHLDRAVVDAVVDPVRRDLQGAGHLRHGQLARDATGVRLAPLDEQPVPQADDRTDSFDPPTLVACLCESGVRETRTLRLSGGRRPA